MNPILSNLNNNTSGGLIGFDNGELALRQNWNVLITTIMQDGRKECSYQEHADITLYRDYWKP